MLTYINQSWRKWKGWFSHGPSRNYSHISEPAPPLGQGEPNMPVVVPLGHARVFNTYYYPTRNNATHLLVKKAVEKSRATRILQKSVWVISEEIIMPGETQTHLQIFSLWILWHDMGCLYKWRNEWYHLYSI